MQINLERRITKITRQRKLKVLKSKLFFKKSIYFFYICTNSQGTVHLNTNPEADLLKVTLEGKNN